MGNRLFLEADFGKYLNWAAFVAAFFPAFNVDELSYPEPLLKDVITTTLGAASLYMPKIYDDRI